MLKDNLFVPFRALRTLLLCFLLSVLWSQVLCAQTLADTVKQDVKLVWSEDYGQGEQVYLSSYEQDHWTPPMQLSASTDMVFHSAVSSGNDGRIWAVWSRIKQGNVLEYTMFSSSGWTEPREILTGMTSNKAVTIIVDKDNVPWIAWEGIEKVYSDIFLSRWNGNSWEKPVKVHPDNDVPDIVPALTLNASGHVVLSWQTFADGKYVYMQKIWDGKQWHTIVQDPGTMSNTKTFRRGTYSIPVPPFIQEPRQATLFMRSDDGAGSIPLTAF